MDIIVNLLKKLNIVPVPLLDTKSPLLRARAILEANHLGVFAALERSRHGMTVAELREHIEISEEGATVLLRALTEIGYLRQRRGRYRNGPWVKRWILDPKHGLSNWLTLQLFAWKRLETLGENLVTGRPTLDYHQLAVSTPSENQAIYTLAMREMAQLLLPSFVKLVEIPTHAKRLIDIGGAHGEYARALVRRYPHLQATVFDLAGPIATAQTISEQEGNPEALAFWAGDALTEDFGHHWDVALLTNVVHVFNAAQNQTLFERIYHALNANSVLFITDQFLGLSTHRDKMASLNALNYFNVGGRNYTVAEMHNLLTRAGFRHIHVKRFPAWLPVSLIEART